MKTLLFNWTLKRLEYLMIVHFISKYIYFRSATMVSISCSPLPGDQPWQVRYQEKAHSPRNVKVIVVRPYNEQLLP